MSQAALNSSILGKTLTLVDRKRHLQQSDVVAFVILVLICALLGPKNEIWLAGLAFGFLGFGIWMIARQQLGLSFSANAEARTLVTTGLYKYFRHPIYYAGFMAHFGLFLALQNWWILSIWFAYSTSIQLVRMKREDRVLEEAFGNDFRELKRSTWI